MYPGAHAQNTPDKPAVIMAGSGEVLTYRELEDSSRRLAVALHDLGLRRGDVIAMLSDNAPEALTIYWAALRSGLYLTAINHHLTAAEAGYIVDDCDARVLIAAARLGELATGIVPLAPRLERTVAFGGTVPGFGRLEVLVDAIGDRDLDDRPRGSDMLYSSGTTGRPKGVKPPLLPIQVDQPGDPLTGLAGQAFGFSAADVYLSPAPIYHAAPLRWCGAVHAYGGTVVLMKRFGAREALAAIERHGVTVTQMVPTMFVRMLQLDPAERAHDLSTLRLAIHAAAPCPVEVKEQMIEWWGPILVEYYSSTESSGLTLITTPQWQTHRGSVGRSMFGPVHVCGEDGAELPAGEVGLVYFEREVRPFEYHKDAAKTKAAEHREHANWTTVGDLGYVDAEGYLYLTDRQSFMIISGGVNIYPQEIENALTLHPSILDVAVIGVPHPEMGEQVKAVVQLRPGIDASDGLAAELIAYAKERVASYKVPRSVDFVDDLPRTPTGKLMKGRLRERFTTPAAAVPGPA